MIAWAGLFAVVFGFASPELTIDSAVRTLQRGATLEVAGERICAAQPLPLFYERRGFQYAWSRNDEDELLQALRRAGDDGLSPGDYHLGAIERLRGDSSRRTERDLLLTDAFFLLTSHLLSGRIDPVTIEPTWCLLRRTSDLVPALETALETHAVPATIAQFRSSHAGYLDLRDHLARHRRMGEWPQIDAGPPLREGVSGSRVQQLSARLGVTPPRSLFDSNLAEAVRRFQRMHGLEADGVVGGRTLREMNVPLAARIRQLELNLERWRWLPATLGERHVLINIPQFQLSVVERGDPILTMRLIVGKDYQHRTPIFSSEIRQIVFSPYWNVPDSIAAKELWPQQNRDRGFFAREHIEVLPNGRLRQKPGPWNALGFIKFDLPNPHTVYLHDTPARALFSQSVRTFSHGCMRVEKPVELAAYLLRGEEGWTVARIVTESQTGVEHTVTVAVPLPVHVLYWTAFVDEAGHLHFASDVYDRDRILDESLRTPAPRF